MSYRPRAPRHPCYQWTGRKKIKHRSLVAAERHAKSLTRKKNHYAMVYECPLEPGYYHVGKQTLHDLNREERKIYYGRDKRMDKHNEVLAGKLVAALIKVLRKP